MNLLQSSRNRDFLQASVAGIRALHIVNRIAREYDGDEQKCIILWSLKAKDSTTGKYFTVPELVSEAVLLLMAGK